MFRAVCLFLIFAMMIPTLALIDEATADQYHEVYLHPQGTIPPYVVPDKENDVELVSTGYFYYNYLTERQSKSINADGIINIIDATWTMEIAPMTFYNLEPNERAVFIITIVVPKGIEPGSIGFFRISVTTHDNLGYSDTDVQNIQIQVGMYDEEIPLPESTIIDQDTRISVPWWGYLSISTLMLIIIISAIVLYRFSTRDTDEISTDDRS